MHLSNSYFRCNKSYKTCPVKGTITISFLFEKEFFLKFVTLKTEITPCPRTNKQQRLYQKVVLGHHSGKY